RLARARALRRAVATRLTRAMPLPPGERGDEHHSEYQQRPAQLRHHAVDTGRAHTAASRTASSTSTVTRRDTPGSFMVTPINCEASSMVLLLWVMNTNCTRVYISRTISQNRATLWSSSGASTCSRRQQGAGQRSKMANTRATALSALSPPDDTSSVQSDLPSPRA